MLIYIIFPIHSRLKIRAFKGFNPALFVRGDRHVNRYHARNNESRWRQYLYVDNDKLIMKEIFKNESKMYR